MATYIYNGYPKLKSIFGFWSDMQTLFWVISQVTLLDDVIANFQFQRLDPY